MFKKTDTALLIDADILLWKHLAAHETEIEWGNDIWTLHTDLRAARASMLDAVHVWMDELDASKLYFAFSGSSNWRLKVLPSYKSNRAKTRKPMGYAQMRQWLCDLFPHDWQPELEADDLLGLAATGTRVKAGRKIIVTIDKDLRTVPGDHYNPDHPEWEVTTITPEEADYNHMLQTLAGDATDGYKGCPGIGAKGAERVLDRGEPLWTSVVAAYETAELGAGDALVQARVARILRSGEYDFRSGNVKLWEPPELSAHAD